MVFNQKSNVWKSIIGGICFLAISLSGLVFAQGANDINSFNIEAGPLKAALISYMKQSGRQIIFLDDDVENVKTQGVDGSFTNEEVLAKILENSGLEVKVDQASGAVLIRAVDSESVTKTTPKGGEEDIQEQTVNKSRDTGEGDVQPKMIEEVVVYARKRQERAQDIPIAITALGEAKIEALGATSFDELIGNVPNLFADLTGYGTSSWGLRGIVSLTRNAGQESGLGVYIDGVYVGRPASFNFPLSDIEQVEVLRGPQGSLFGRNTIGGAINATTKKPGEEMAGNIKATLGNYSKTDFEADISGPLVEGVLSGKISAFLYQRDGYVDNLFDNDEYMDGDRVGGRFGLYWTASDNFEVVLSGDYLKVDNQQLFGIPLEPQLNNIVPGWYQSDRFDVNQNDPNKEEIDSGGASLTINWELDSGFSITSITAKRISDFEQISDDDAGPITLTHSHFKDESEIFSQELRLASPTNGRFDYLVGLFYLDQEITADRDTPVLPFPDNFVGISSDTKVTSEAWAIFGSANLYLTDALRLTLGLRYTDEEKESQFSQVENAGLGFPTVSFSPKQQDDAFSGDVSLAYAVDDNANIYGSIRKGVKSGGFQTDIITFMTEDFFVFGPEEAVSYELGVKGAFFDRTLMVNAALFRTDYTDVQVSAPIGLGFTTLNAAEAEINGFELEVEWRATENLSLAVSMGLLDHEYTKYENCLAGSGIGLDDCSGNDLQLVPDWTASANLDYRFPLSDGAALEFHVDWNARDEYFVDPSNDPDRLVEDRGLVNARIGYVAADESYSIYLWGKNLADEEYDTVRWKYPVTPLVFGGLDPTITGLNRLVGAPRMYGIEVAYRF